MLRGGLPEEEIGETFVRVIRAHSRSMEDILWEYPKRRKRRKIVLDSLRLAHCICIALPPRGAGGGEERGGKGDEERRRN